MVMWIVLGSLVGLVAIFLVVTTILDRKKRAKLKNMEVQTNAETAEAKIEIVYFASEIIKANSKLLKDFVPSVGKLKMSDVRNKAKDALKVLTDSKEYKLIEDEQDCQEFVKNLNGLKHINSNNWDKSEEVKFIQNELKIINGEVKAANKKTAKKAVETKSKKAKSNAKPEPVVRLTDEYKDEVKKMLKEIY